MTSAFLAERRRREVIGLAENKMDFALRANDEKCPAFMLKPRGNARMVYDVATNRVIENCRLPFDSIINSLADLQTKQV